ncbi:pantetheinase-like [Lethenteron reissneri]|uniref:pantetheinase-like n=1 Tax=Lethenteron reissneri TaxID=7753 RepID=UPI002AB67A47|nr:pantetheinase-like [Lethenteron reissneri]XP_061415976.1 pantetheinase-like [Lethenteron reissneri]
MEVRGYYWWCWFGVLLTLATLLGGTQGATQGSTGRRFTAAVLEHAVLLPSPRAQGTLPTRAEALTLMHSNLDIMEPLIRKAASMGADIVVSPEDGLYGWTLSREEAQFYMEDILDPSTQPVWVPCEQPPSANDLEPGSVLSRLSCLARDLSVYLVANLGDGKECDRGSDPRCPPDSRYQFNTDVVLDRLGRLVGRYHKYRLFMGEDQFDQPAEPTQVIVETDFGRLGVFTCFDILFRAPAVQLVEEGAVDTVLFPTAWMNVLPHLSAVQFHSAWAMGMAVNMLAANTHNTTNRMTGSGIYSPDGARAYHYDAVTGNGHLLLAELDVSPRAPGYQRPDWGRHAFALAPPSPGASSPPSFTADVFHDPFTMVLLAAGAGNASVCHGELCCHLEFATEAAEEPRAAGELHALGAFSGLHVVEGQYYLQICTLLKCAGAEKETCGHPTKEAATRFSRFSLSGTFGTRHVFPEVLLSGVDLAPGQFQVLDDGRLMNSDVGLQGPPLSVTLFGRWYERDEGDCCGGGPSGPGSIGRGRWQVAMLGLCTAAVATLLTGVAMR